jgi:cytochrome c
MSTETTKKKTSPLPIYIAGAILIVFALIFGWEFIQLSRATGGEGDLTAQTYMDEVEPLLAGADPVHGAALVEQYGCNACHAGENAGRLAPGHAEVAERATERRPPLSAGGYIYESIIYPGAYIVEGYMNNMPRIYDDEIPADDLGDIIAYLLLTEEEKMALDAG